MEHDPVTVREYKKSGTVHEGRGIRTRSVDGEEP